MKLPETPAWKLKSHGITDQAYYERTLPTPAGGVEINIHLLLDLAKSILKQPHRVTTAMIQRNTLHPSPKICSYLLSRIQVSAKASRSIHESVTFERQPLNTQHDSLSYPREKKKKWTKSLAAFINLARSQFYLVIKTLVGLITAFSVTPKLSPLIIMCPCFSPSAKQEP